MNSEKVTAMAPADNHGGSLAWPQRINEIPKEVFVRSDIFERELQTIFYGPQWHPLAHQGELPKPGDFKTVDLGRIPLIVSRGQDNEVRVFVNSCAHRGNQVETATCGNRKEFECPYHRWLFTTAGKLVACPGMDDFAPDFDKADHGLRQLRTAEFHGLVFATMSESAPPLESWLGEAAPTLQEVLGGDGRLRLLGYQKVQYATNWKAYADNDGYHAPLLHTGFRLLQWQGGQGTQRVTANGHLAFESQLKPVQNRGFLKDPSLIDFKGENPEKGSRVVQLFPMAVMVKHLDVINLRFAIPRSVDSTEVHYAYFSHEGDDAEMVHHRVRQSSNLLGPCGMVSMEDASIFQRIHIGSHSPGNVGFQKGVKRLDELWFDFKQNDEAGNLPKWDYYRRLMGYRRTGEPSND